MKCLTWLARGAVSTGMLIGVGFAGASLAAPAMAAPIQAQTGVCNIQSYPPGQVGIQIPTNTVTPGETITVTGEGFAPDTTVVLTLQQTGAQLASVTTDAQGAFTTSITIPTGLAPGRYTIVATGGCPSNPALTLGLSAQVTVTARPATVTPPGQSGNGTPAANAAAPAASAAGAGGPLAFTGTESLATVLASLALIVAGSAVVLVSRRRRRSRRIA